jgi:tetratricopeptide (TPR) repeat protein
MNRKRHRGYLSAAIAFSIALTIAGCSLTPVQSQQPGWSCDPEADAAVHSEQWRLALQLHRRFLVLEPDNCLAIYHLGYILGKLDERQQEVEAYEHAVACGYAQDDRLFFNLGMAFSDLLESDKAVQALERAVELNPNNAENHFGLGYIAHLADQSALAIEALQTAIDLSEDHLDARNLLARIYLDEGRLVEAKALLIQVQRREPANPEAMILWQIYEDRAMTSYDQ